jgi:hypothetical protein
VGERRAARAVDGGGAVTERGLRHVNIANERVLLEESRLVAAIDVLGDPAVSSLVGQSVVTGLIRLLKQQRADLASLRETGEDIRWTSVHNRVQMSDGLLAECAALISGSYARPLGRLDCACSEAELVAADLSAITGIAAGTAVIPADTECASLVSSVLRRRFADHGIWDLPVVAHEFGHLVVRDLIQADLFTAATKRPLTDLVFGHQHQMAELAADIFAVFAIGPAYALTMTFHRMDPTAPAVSAHDASHPGDASRVHAVLYGLELLAREDIPERREQYAFILKALREFWNDAQTDAGDEARLDDYGAARVRAHVDKIWGCLIGSSLHSARYATFRKARQLADTFGNRVDSTDSADSTLDIVNAAWLVRFRSWRDGTRCPATLESWAQQRISALKSRTTGHG